MIFGIRSDRFVDFKVEAFHGDYGDWYVTLIDPLRSLRSGQDCTNINKENKGIAFMMEAIMKVVFELTCGLWMIRSLRNSIVF